MIPNDTPIALTDTDVRQIVTSQLATQLPDLESRINTATREALKEALRNIPTEDTVRAMIESRIKDVRGEMQESINSVDIHLRQAEGRVSDAVKRIDKAADRFEATSDKMESAISRLESRSEVNSGNIAALQRETDSIRVQAESDRKELTQTIDHLDSLKADVHGDPEKPEMPSLFRVVALTNDNIKNLDTRLARYDAMVNFALRIWNTKVGKAVIISLLTAFTTDAVYQAAKIWQVLLGGK